METLTFPPSSSSSFSKTRLGSERGRTTCNGSFLFRALHKRRRGRTKEDSFTRGGRRSKSEKSESGWKVTPRRRVWKLTHSLAVYSSTFQGSKCIIAKVFAGFFLLPAVQQIAVSRWRFYCMDGKRNGGGGRKAFFRALYGRTRGRRGRYGLYDDEEEAGDGICQIPFSFAQAWAPICHLPTHFIYRYILLRRGTFIPAERTIESFKKNT